MLQATDAGRCPSPKSSVAWDPCSRYHPTPQAYYVTVRIITAVASGRASHAAAQWRLEAGGWRPVAFSPAAGLVCTSNVNQVTAAQHRGL